MIDSQTGENLISDEPVYATVVVLPKEKLSRLVSFPRQLRVRPDGAVELQALPGIVRLHLMGAEGKSSRWAVDAREFAATPTVQVIEREVATAKIEVRAFAK